MKMKDGVSLDLESVPSPKIAGYGWIPDLPDHRDHVFAASREVLRSLPARVDLRPDCPPVYDQGHIGSCTANAIAAALEYDQFHQGYRNVFTPSRLFIYYNQRLMESTDNYDAGAMLRNGIKSVSKLGVCPETTWPYDPNPFPPSPLVPPLSSNARLDVQPPPSAYTQARQHRPVSYQRVQRTLSQMKGCLASGHPFVFGFTVYDSFESNAVAKSGAVPMPGPGEALQGGHAVMAVGYDDVQSRFLCRNSWKPKWGMRGYFTLPYAYLLDESLSDDFWMMTTVKG